MNPSADNPRFPAPGEVFVKRFAYSPMGAFGILTAGAFQCFTVERPWQDNRPMVSCIPEGDYRIVLGRYHRGGYPAYELREVPGRSQIKIHRGNTMENVKGCIAPGMDLGWIGGAWAVTQSRKALDGFMRAMEGRTSGVIRIASAPPHPEFPMDTVVT